MLEAPAHAALDPLVELATACDEFGEVCAVPRRHIPLERPRVGSGQPAAGAMATHAAESLGALQATGRERILSFRHPRGGLDVGDEILHLLLREPPLEGRHLQDAPFALLTPGLARLPLLREAVMDPLVDLIR